MTDHFAPSPSNASLVPGAAPPAVLLGRLTARGALVVAAKEVSKKGASQLVAQGAKTLAKGGANPAFVACDLLELGVEKATGNKVAAKGSSLAGYVTIGACCGGPAGAGVGAAAWCFSQVVGLVFE